MDQNLKDILGFAPFKSMAAHLLAGPSEKAGPCESTEFGPDLWMVQHVNC